MDTEQKNNFRAAFSISTSRLESFSDGVFVIILTLLVLDLHIPQIVHPNSASELIAALKHVAPNFRSFSASFFTICFIWISHHRLFKGFKVVPHALFFLNAIFLFYACLIPFPTSMVGAYPNNSIALFLYGMLIFNLMLIFSFMQAYGLKHPNILVQEYKEMISFFKINKHVMFTIILQLSSPLIGAFISYFYPFMGMWTYLIIMILTFMIHAIVLIKNHALQEN